MTKNSMTKTRTKKLAGMTTLKALEQKVLWLASWTIHNANHLRPKDEIKVGGHQASCASMVTLMTALYFRVLRPQDRIAVKPHASPVFHAIQYLLGHQTREKLETFRGFGGAQSYPSRTKDVDDVDFSTGSVGLGVAITAFASLIQDYVRSKGWSKDRAEGRMIALVGDAELDEGNIYECLQEGWKQGLRNTWWIIDYNRQSLDGVVREGLYDRLEGVFRAFGWDVITLKYGALQREAFAEPGGEKLKAWIDSCPNPLYSALMFQGGAAWRKRLMDEIGDQGPVTALLEKRSDGQLAELMANLGGHCLETVTEAFEGVDHDRPVVFIAYTVKGWGTPLAGHKDNHAGLMTPDQMEGFRQQMQVRKGHEWDPFEGLSQPESELKSFLETVPFNAEGRRRLEAAPVAAEAPVMIDEKVIATQAAFGKVLDQLARGDSALAERIVTTSPDVTVSTNLGPWVNRRGLFARDAIADTFRDERIPSAQKWHFAPEGQHIELGIAEMNLFLLLGAAGLSHSLFGERLLPIGTLYDPFISRGLDALNYACYQDARFLLVATPSGVSLAPEGGAQQREPGPNCEVVIAYQGVIAPEAITAAGMIGEDRRDVGVLAVTSADRLNAGWQAAQRARIRGQADALSHVERLMAGLPPHCTLVTVIDGHPATLSWLSGVYGHRAVSLGVEHFGQTGTIADLYHHYGIDADNIAAAAAAMAPGRPVKQLRFVG
jgi:pyruvate dehydrogenase E1 component